MPWYASGVGMYDPRPLRLHAIASLRDLPSRKVGSPGAPAFTTKIGRSGPRPLTTTNISSERTGVGAVIFELPPSRHNSLPVRGSYAKDIGRSMMSALAFLLWDDVIAMQGVE